MARIRSIHPGLLTDEAFMAITVEAPILVPLLFGLWTEADDAGTFEWKPLTLKARVLPALAEKIDAMLDDLASRGFIRRFTFDGRPYGVVRNFVKFQRPKAPKDIHPSSAESRQFAGFLPNGKRPNATTGRKAIADGSEPDSDDDGGGGNEFGSGSEVVPPEFGTGSGISAQMEDGGGREDTSSLRSDDAARVSAAAEAAATSPEKPIVEILFGSCLRYLVSNGVPDKNARSVIGKWRRDYGDGEVAAAIGEAQKDAASEPIPLVSAILQQRRQHAAARARGDPPAISKSAIARNMFGAALDAQPHRPDPSRDAAAVQLAQGYRERAAGHSLPEHRLRLAGPDEAERH